MKSLFLFFKKKYIIYRCMRNYKKLFKNIDFNKDKSEKERIEEINEFCKKNNLKIKKIVFNKENQSFDVECFFVKSEYFDIEEKYDLLLDLLEASLKNYMNNGT